MIANKSRADWFGASDTGTIMGNWKTKTFASWWLKKIGIDTSSFSNKYTLAGTHWEHRILDFVDCDMEKDKQILIPELRLRINLDGNTKTQIYECKTHKEENPFAPIKHLPQVNVQIFGARRNGMPIKAAYIVSYAMQEYDYHNYLADIDKDRLQRHEVEYDESFMQKYLCRLEYLCSCLNNGRFPKMEDL